jgi:alcohol dehydrogenase YqhD (iron-dependent ADH family)
LGRITALLAENNISYCEYGGVMPNPHLSYARAGVAAALEFGADFILAVGGGSAIDAAKAIAHGTANPEADIWKYWLREEIVEKSLPVGVVLTISAAGSETSWSAVLTNTETGSKRGLSTDFNRPAFAIMNPELTYTLPKYQIACGVADIMMHTMDRYFSPESIKGVYNEVTDAFAEGLLRVVIKNGLIALEEPTNYQAQSELMWCGSLSHNGITGLGNSHDFSVHQLGHELSAMFDVTHGASLTTVWGAWARHVMHVNPSRFAWFAKEVWTFDDLVKSCQALEDTALAGISATDKYFKLLGLPVSFSELGIGVQPDEVLRELAFSCVHRGKRLVGSFKPLNQDDIYAIFKAVNK